MLQTLEGMFAKSTASERQVAITYDWWVCEGSLFGNDFTYQSSGSDGGKTSKGDKNRSHLAITA